MKATASDADYGELTSESYQALQAARKRRAAPGYVLGDSIRRKMEEPISTTQIDDRLLFRRAGIPSREWGMSFHEVGRNDDLQGVWKARAARVGGFCVTPGFREAYDWMRAWEPTQGSVWLEGLVGTGKTLLAATAAMRLLSTPLALRFVERDGVVGVSRGGAVPVLWTNERSLFRDEKATQRFGGRGPDSFAARAIEVSVLVIDDFLSIEGSNKETRDISDMWEWVIGERYNEQRSCIWTSNRPQTDIEAVHGARMADRIAEMTCSYSLQVDGPSWRKA